MKMEMEKIGKEESINEVAKQRRYNIVYMQAGEDPELVVKGLTLKQAIKEQQEYIQILFEEARDTFNINKKYSPLYKKYVYYISGEGEDEDAEYEYKAQAKKAVSTQTCTMLQNTNYYYQSIGGEYVILDTLKNKIVTNIVINKNTKEIEDINYTTYAEPDWEPIYNFTTQKVISCSQSTILDKIVDEEYR